MSAKNNGIQVRLTDDQLSRSKVAADADGVSVAEVIRRALDALLVKPCRRCGGTGSEPARAKRTYAAAMVRAK